MNRFKLWSKLPHPRPLSQGEGSLANDKKERIWEMLFKAPLLGRGAGVRLFNSWYFVLGTALISSCGEKDKTSPGYEFMPDMYRSASYETYSENPNYQDGMTARKPVNGTIPRGFMPYSYPNTNEGYEAAGLTLVNPILKNENVLEEGKMLYVNFCSHCHGDDGSGNGTIILNDKFPPPPSFKTQLKDLPDGKMFHSITYGKNMMGAHASQISIDERWKIVHYLNQLQE